MNRLLLFALCLGSLTVSLAHAETLRAGADAEFAHVEFDFTFTA